MCWFSLIQVTVAQSGNYVFSGSEAVNFGTISLSTSSSWGTDRMATPGYFAAYGTATYTDASDVNNINGYVKHYVQAANQEFTFPVGTGSDLRKLTTSGTIPNGLTVGTAWILGNPSSTTDPTDGVTHSTSSLGTGITGISTVGQWDWVVSSGLAAGVTVTVSIPDLSSFGPAAQLRLVGWNGSQWLNLSGSTGASGNTENSTLSGTMQAGITAIGVGLSAPVGDATVDCSKTQIISAPVAGTASQHILAVTANVTTPGTFTVSVRDSGMTLVSNITSVSATTTGVQTLYIPINYDGTTLGTLTFTVGSNSCTANLTVLPKQVITKIWTLDCLPTVGPGLK